MKKNRTTGGLGWSIRGFLLFAVVAVALVTTSEAKLFNWFNKEKITNKGGDTGAKQALETVLLLQSQKKITEAANKLDQLATENKLLSDFSAVDKSVKMIAGFAKTEDQNVDHYATFKDGLEKELKRNGFDLSYDQLRSGTRARAPRPTGQDSSSAPSIEQIIATAVNETIKRLSQTGSLSLRWLTVRDGATFLGPATFKSDIDIDANVEIDGSLTVGENLTVKGNTTLGDSDTDTVTIHAATSINTTGAAATAIGNSGTTTTILGTTNVNATGSAATNIGNTSGGTVIIDAATGDDEINIGSTTGANPGINIGSSAISTDVDQTINIGTGTINSSGTPSRTINIGSSSIGAGTENINIGTHAATAGTGVRDISIGCSGANGTRTVYILSRASDGQVRINTFGSATTNIGNVDATTTIIGTTNINASGVAVTTIGNGTAPVKINTANTNAATHVEVNGSSVPIGLRIIRGTIDGISPTGISEGQGFTFSVVGTGHYRITFDSAFTDIPSVVATTIDSSNTIVRVDSLTTSSVDFKSFAVNGTTATSSEFCFIAMGPTGV